MGSEMCIRDRVRREAHSCRCGRAEVRREAHNALAMEEVQEGLRSHATAVVQAEVRTHHHREKAEGQMAPRTPRAQEGGYLRERKGCWSPDVSSLAAGQREDRTTCLVLLRRLWELKLGGR